MTASRPPARAACVLAALGTLAAALPAHAEASLRWRGELTSDLRLLADDSLAYERLENRAQAWLSARLSKHIAAQAHARLFLTDYAAPGDLVGLTDRTRLDPYRLESDALFVELRDVGLDGLDLRLGRQQIIWGSADRFHPLSNLNPLDLEDPLLFGAVIANEMISLSYRPDFWLGDEDEPTLDDVALQLVFIPFFKPAQLPGSAGLAFTDEEVFAHRANTAVLRRLVDQQRALTAVGWTFAYEPRVVLPERTLDNSMEAARLSWRLWDVDMGVSYFRGFDAFPRAEKIRAQVDVTDVRSDILLSYPRKQVLGFDMATSLGFLDGAGFWAEVGVTLHDDLFRVVDTGPTIGINELEREFRAGAFVKATVGMDYTPTPWLYINVQYLHGFLDEFGAGALHDYLVAGADFKLATDRVLLRLFPIFDLTDGSYVLFPQLTFKPWTGGELSVGAFLYSSLFTGYDESTKFGSRAAGTSSVFVQARALF